MGDVGRESASTDGSRQRRRPSATPLHLHNADDAKQRVLELNEQEDSKDDKEKRTYGRTPDGQGKVSHRQAETDPRQQQQLCHQLRP